MTNVTFSSSDASISDTCPQTFNYSAAITTNGAGSVTYHWVFSDGTTTSPQTISYSGAGTKTISGNMVAQCQRKLLGEAIHRRTKPSTVRNAEPELNLFACLCGHRGDLLFQRPDHHRHLPADL